jgi:hypothetical protein
VDRDDAELPAASGAEVLGIRVHPDRIVRQLPEQGPEFVDKRAVDVARSGQRCRRLATH